MVSLSLDELSATSMLSRSRSSDGEKSPPPQVRYLAQGLKSKTDSGGQRSTVVTPASHGLNRTENDAHEIWLCSRILPSGQERKSVGGRWDNRMSTGKKGIGLGQPSE